MIGKVKSVSKFSKSIIKACPDVTNLSESKGDVKVLLVFRNEYNKIVGVVSLEYFGFEIPGKSVKPLWEIFICSFEVCKKYRGQGYGKEMLNWIEQTLPVSKIMLNYRTKDADNYASRNFWRHMGFKVTDPYFHNMEKPIKR